jgi:hypothetical protein
MEKAILVIMVIAAMVSPAFAQVAKEAIGTVDSIDPIDPARGDYDGGIILKDTDSGVKSFDIGTTTVISDQDTGKIDSSDLQDGDKVRVAYTESTQGPSAITILRLEANAKNKEIHEEAS